MQTLYITEIKLRLDGASLSIWTWVVPDKHFKNDQKGWSQLTNKPNCLKNGYLDVYYGAFFRQKMYKLLVSMYTEVEMTNEYKYMIRKCTFHFILISIVALFSEFSVIGSFRAGPPSNAISYTKKCKSIKICFQSNTP